MASNNNDDDLLVDNDYDDRAPLFNHNDNDHDDVLLNDHGTQF